MGRVVSYSNTDMKVFALLFLAAACLASPDPRQMTCDECVEEMHRMSFIVKLKAREIEQYLTANYCPTLPEYVVYLQQQWCTDPRCHDAVATHFPSMHAMAMEQFWDATATCNQYAQVCGATKPPTEKPSA